MIRLSKLTSRNFRQILAAFDKVFAGNARRQSVNLEHVCQELSTKGIFTLETGSRLSEHSRLEIYAEVRKTDPILQISFIPNLPQLPQVGEFTRIKQMASRFDEELLALFGNDVAARERIRQGQGERQQPSRERRRGERPRVGGPAPERNRDDRPRGGRDRVRRGDRPIVPRTDAAASQAAPPDGNQRERADGNQRERADGSPRTGRPRVRGRRGGRNTPRRTDS